MISLLVCMVIAISTWPLMFALGWRQGAIRQQRVSAAAHLKSLAARSQGGRLLQTKTGATILESNSLAHAECGGLWGKWTRTTAKTLRTPDLSRYNSIADKIVASKSASYIEVVVQERVCDQCGYTEQRRIAS